MVSISVAVGHSDEIQESAGSRRDTGGRCCSLLVFHTGQNTTKAAGRALYLVLLELYLVLLVHLGPYLALRVYLGHFLECLVHLRLVQVRLALHRGQLASSVACLVYLPVPQVEMRNNLVNFRDNLVQLRDKLVQLLDTLTYLWEVPVELDSNDNQELEHE